MNLVIEHQPARGRFQAIVDGEACVADYRLDGGVMLITHTAVAPRLQGRGIAGALVQAALDHARSQGLQVNPLCSYARAYLRRHPQNPAAAPMPPEARAVLDFWFGAAGSPEHGTQRELWFRKCDATDHDITQRFGPLLERALGGEFGGWAAHAPSALAHIVLLDQFTRNAFRGTPRAFAGDARALAAAQAMVQARHDEALPPMQRAFVYLPFEHAEDLALQDEAVRLFTRLAAAAPEVQGMLEYARKHRAVIERFGRFPHRNATLNRPSNAQEQAYLLQPGSGF